MKHRRRKHRQARRLRLAFCAIKRELGDHRRWLWQATMPYIYFDKVFDCDTEVTFDPQYGRLYRPLNAFSGKENSQ
jgi:hypothetical protein